MPLLNDTTYIAIDVEAALVRGKQQVIEIGAVKYYSDGTKDTFSELIQPYKFKKLTKYYQQLTGITNEELLTAPTFKEVIKQFQKWCGSNYVLLTFGEFDRKALEDDCERNGVNNQFLYPIIDFQQKYMISRQLKNQPSLNGLMKELGMEAENQHRALVDADSLMRIFQKVKGEQLIRAQETNEFIILLGQLKDNETSYSAQITAIEGKIEDGKLLIESIESRVNELPFQVEIITKKKKDSEETYEKEVIHIEANENMKIFMQKIIRSIKGQVIITRNGLKKLNRLFKLHQCELPKTEVMSLKSVLNNEHLVEKFLYNGEPIADYEKRVFQIIEKNQQKIIAEYMKRALLE